MVRLVSFMTNHQSCSLLVVDDEPYILTTLRALFAQDFEVLTADCGQEALAILSQRPVDILLTDQKMPGMKGVDLLAWARENSPRSVRLLMTGFAEFEDAVDAINRARVHRFIFKPWHAEELIQTMRDAGRSFRLEQQNEQLLGELRRLNLELEQRVIDRTSRLEEANQELHKKNTMLERLALTDPLTGLPNRRAIDRLAEAEIRRRARYPGCLCVGVLDADHFKEINDRYLLPGGDRVLVDLAKVLAASVRTVDTVGRIGGEEFMVLAPETSLEGAFVLGERIRTAVEQYSFDYNGETIQVTVSGGFVVADAGSEIEYDGLKHIAAAALAEAKSTGRNRCVVRMLSAPVAAAVPTAALS
jgi:diguanylate cyclase (GGDEF)-like protein